MKLTEVIEHLDRSLTIRPSIKDANFDKAARIGIEAVKVIQNLREDSILFDAELLPGETKEGDS